MAFIQSLIINPWTIIILVILVGLYLLWRARGKEFKGLDGSSMLTAYTRDLTADARAGKVEPVIGREDETERVIHILSRKTQNNPILLGEPGVGKTAIVEGLVRRIAAGDVPDVLRNKDEYDRLIKPDDALGGNISFSL